MQNAAKVTKLKSSFTQINQNMERAQLTRMFVKKSDSERNRTKYQIAQVASWAFGALSALTASSFLLFWLESITHNWYIAASVAIIFSILFELYRRSEYKDVFVSYYESNGSKLDWKSITTLLCLFAIGTTMSVFGAKMGIERFHPEAQFISFQKESAFVQSQIDDIDKQVADIQNDPSKKNHKGIVLWKYSNGILPDLANQRAALSAKLVSINEQVVAQNGEIGTDHESEVDNNAWMGGFANIPIELVLFVSLGFIVKYKYARSIELGLFETKKA